MTAYALPFDSEEVRLATVGGKGISLSRMSRAGFPIPPGFFITTDAYCAFVQANHLQEQIVNLANSEADTSEAKSAAIRQLFVSGKISAEIADAIHRAYAGLMQIAGDLPLAVRSSATAEDLPGASFAGQQESYLNVHGEQAVLEAVRRCWSSLWTSRALDYRARQGIDPAAVSLAVVVQVMVPAEASGIMFTANPMSGCRDEIVLDAAWGLGEAIVGGLVTPDHIIADKATGTIKQIAIGDKAIMTAPTATGTEEREVEEHRRRAQVLNAAQVAELMKLGVAIESLYGVPQDIEWCIVNGAFSIVQARPITALRETAARSVVAQPVEWNPPNPKGRYMRGSIIEFMPDPLTPLFATLVLPAWSKVAVDWQEMMGWGKVLSTAPFPLINGYAYYDFTINTARMIPALPRTMRTWVRLLRSARQRWEQEALPAYREVVERWEASDLHASSAALLLDGALEVMTMGCSYYMTFMDGIAPAARFSESLFTTVYERLLKRRGDPSALTFLLGYESEPIRAEQSLYQLAQWVLDQEGLADTLRQMSGEQFTVAYQREPTGPTDEAAVWVAFWQRLARHLARYGYAIYDYDIAKPLLIEDPAPLLETLKFFLSGHAPNPTARQAASTAEREQAMHILQAKKPGFIRAWAQRLLQTAQCFAPLREDAIAYQGLGWPVARRMLREIGQRLVAAGACHDRDDVFWLTAEELQAAVRALDGEEAVAHLHARASEHRRLWEQQRQLTPPASLPLKGKLRLLGLDMSWWAPANTQQQAGDMIKGIGTSPGRITGQVRVIHGPDEFDQMQPGGILVTRITTPAWTPLFALAAGVVTDIGGPLSHSSIVAREYRIPAVLGTGIATERLQNGQRVIVDGDAGTVTIMNTGK